MARRNAKSNRLARQVAELALAAPQVVAHRTARMAGAGVAPSRRDQAEFVRMGSEKLEAFHQSWSAMWAMGWTAQLEFAAAATTATSRALAAASSSAMEVLSAGLAPVHRRAVSNARRLSRRRK